MFNTELLHEILEQLQSGASNNYFEALGLILQLIGLCAGPILFIAFGLFLVFGLPQRLAAFFSKLGFKGPYYIIEVAITKKGKAKLDYYKTKEYEKHEKIRLRIHLCLFVVAAIMFILLVSPFFFLNISPITDAIVQAVLVSFMIVVWLPLCVGRALAIPKSRPSVEPYGFVEKIEEYLHNNSGDMSKIGNLKLYFKDLPVNIVVTHEL